MAAQILPFLQRDIVDSAIPEGDTVDSSVCLERNLSDGKMDRKVKQIQGASPRLYQGL